ncbi:hypothetical protein [Sphingomonas alpina]|nr:hypothetical protein [Sphingomonas alpina]
MQRDGLAGAGGARDQAVAIGALQLELLGMLAAEAAADEDRSVRHDRSSN